MLKLKPVRSFDVSNSQLDNQPGDFICQHEFELEYESKFEFPLIVKKIGTVSIQVIDVDAAVEAGVSMRNLFEGDVHLSWMHSTLFDVKLRKNDFSPNVHFAISKSVIRSKQIVNLESIEIDSQFRGYGFGMMVVAQLIKMFRQGGGLFAAGVFPTGLKGDSKKVDEVTRKIKKKYESVGMKQVARSDWLIRDLCEPISADWTGCSIGRLTDAFDTKYVKIRQNSLNQL